MVYWFGAVFVLVRFVLGILAIHECSDYLLLEILPKAGLAEYMLSLFTF